MMQEKLSIYFYRAGDNCIWHFSHGMGLPFYCVADSERLDPDYFIETADPECADFFVFPYDLGAAINLIGIRHISTILRKLKYFSRYESRHVFVLGHDESRPFGFDSIFFRNGANSIYSDPQTFALPYPCDDFSEMVDVDFTELPYDTSFVGFQGHNLLRSVMARSVDRCSELRSKLSLRPAFFTHLSSQVQDNYRREFLDSLALARTVLCPRGEGEGSVRLFEALSAGRVPVMLADEYKFPFSDSISYDDLILKIPQSQAEHTGIILAQWLATHSPERLQKMGRAGRKAWEDYLCPGVWLKGVFQKLVQIKSRTVAIAPEVVAPLDYGWWDKPLSFHMFSDRFQLNGVESVLTPALLHSLYVKAADLPGNSVAVYLAPEDPLTVLFLAGGLACSGYHSSILYTVSEQPLVELSASLESAGLQTRVSHHDALPYESVARFSIREVDLLVLDHNFPFDILEHVICDWVPKIRFGGMIIVYLPASRKEFSSKFQDFLEQKGFVCDFVRQSPYLKVAEIQYKMQAAVRHKLKVNQDLKVRISLFGCDRHPVSLRLFTAFDAPLPLAVSEVFQLGNDQVLFYPDNSCELPAEDVAKLLTLLVQNPKLAAVAPVSERLRLTDSDGDSEGLFFIDDLGFSPVLFNCRAVQKVGGLNKNLTSKQIFTNLYERFKAAGYEVAITRDVVLEKFIPDYYFMGMQFLQYHNYQLAIKCFVAELELTSPENRSEIYNFLALAYHKSGQEAEAQLCNRLAATET